MLKTLMTNNIIVSQSYDGSLIKERVLFIDRDNMDIYVINIDKDDNSLPVQRNLTLVLKDLKDGHVQIDEYDPYSRFICEEDIKVKDKQHRDKTWQYIEEAVSAENIPQIFYKKHRGPLGKFLQEKYGVNHVTFYSNLKKYWKRGQTKNALLPDSHKYGGRGVDKKLGDKKVGRRKEFPEESGIGVNITEEIYIIFLECFKNIHRDPKKKNLRLKYFYTIMINEHFKDKVTSGKVPSLRQFTYWYKKEFDIEESKRHRHGNGNYDRNHRPILGTSMQGVPGPGSYYQMDATPANFYIVSRFNRSWVLRKPWIYLVVDVFSRLIAGFYVGLENPSYIGVMMALASAASDKAKVCKEYNIELDESEWKAKGLPDAIIADKGELISKNAETLINAHQVRIENNPPGRADLKGIVERLFKKMDELISDLPGYEQKDSRSRGATDYRLDAELTLDEFTWYFIQAIRHHNKSYLPTYEKTLPMTKENVRPIPSEIWNWGVERTGAIRWQEVDKLKINLMPIGTAKVTRAGIKFNGLHYVCKRGEEEKWFHRAKEGEWKIKVSYDPRIVNEIYYRDKLWNTEVCSLLERDTEKFYNMSFTEVIDCQRRDKREAAREKKMQLKKDVDFLDMKLNRKKTSAARSKEEPKSTKNMNDRTAAEKAVNRLKESFVPSNHKSHERGANNIEFSEQAVFKVDVRQSSYLEKLQKHSQKIKRTGEYH
ncbi:Mu transposase C-terminal domain-containing protein [Paenibacillus sp. GCM10023248]|uniref:Mu transposase C-terminal domain-containing protein n=1 Tax=unclassified Paenibacillus TaxID=185978 RepID=UPI00237852D9|nr:Mu transposase C-terminal domain-containing protein [Paenibacillus sp. MAHUQ-63]MDD9267872.1 DDE-type integrase/transposase/recombinase [Paenibacillus sp. MAHUQ-63]